MSRAAFFKRVAVNFAAASSVIGASLFAGMAGYMYFEDMQGIDAFVNAAMILSGMGPLASPATWGGKFFAGCYALYSGLILIVAAGVVGAPILHRLLHRFHIDDRER